MSSYSVSGILGISGFHIITIQKMV